MPTEFGQLVAVDGGSVILLTKTRCIVGRAPDCDMVLAYRTVSSKHCLLEFRDGSWYVTDLASSNGTRVNGERCMSVPLRPGDLLGIAEYQFEIRYLNAPTALPPLVYRKLDVGNLNSEMSQASATAIPARPNQVFGSAADRSSYSSNRPTLGNLIPLDGGDQIRLMGVRILVGRSPVCNVVLTYPEVSSKHCQLDLQDGVWHVRDLGSRNGIQIDGKASIGGPLHPNSVLSVAKHRFKVVYESVPEEPAPSMAPPKAAFDLNSVQQSDRIVFTDLPESMFALEMHSSGELSLSGENEL